MMRLVLSFAVAAAVAVAFWSPASAKEAKPNRPKTRDECKVELGYRPGQLVTQRVADALDRCTADSRR